MELLKPFIVTSAHCNPDDLTTLEPTVREIFTASPLSQDPQRTNVFMFVLDATGQVVHAFHGLPSGRGSTYYDTEIRKALGRLKAPEGKPRGGLPDLPAATNGKPSGVRLLVRQDSSRLPIIELLPMTSADWEPLAYSAQTRLVAAESLKPWLAQLYPAAIRAVDALKPYRSFGGTLQLEPAGTAGTTRYALLRGRIQLLKADETESSFAGDLEAVVTYTSTSPEVSSLRGLVEGVYLYRQRGTTSVKLTAFIESRPQ